MAIDGSKFKAVNNRDRNFTAGKDRQTPAADRGKHPALPGRAGDCRSHAASGTGSQDERLQDKIAQLRQQMRDLDVAREQLKTQPDGQFSLTDPDARSMNSAGKGSGIVGYNVQAAVDAKHHLIVAHEVTNVGNDRAQLSPMAQAAREAMGKKRLKAVADRGYFNCTTNQSLRRHRYSRDLTQANDIERKGRGSIRQG